MTVAGVAAIGSLATAGALVHAASGYAALLDWPFHLFTVWCASPIFYWSGWAVRRISRCERVASA